MPSKPEAYVNWNAGTCRIICWRTQTIVCQSQSFQRATRKARLAGYNVRVYCGFNKPTAEEISRRRRFGVVGRYLTSTGVYILPRVSA